MTAPMAAPITRSFFLLLQMKNLYHLLWKAIIACNCLFFICTKSLVSNNNNDVFRFYVTPKTKKVFFKISNSLKIQAYL